MAHPTAASTPKPRLSQVDELRSRAQEHLEEIAHDLTREQEDEARKARDLQRYAKHRRRSRDSDARGTSDMAKPKMRSAQDVLQRLKWDEDLDIAQFRVGYLERFEGVKEVAASSWISESTDEEWIPQHRIKYFKCCSNGQEVIVWDREKRVDKIFGGGAQHARTDESDTEDTRTEDGGVAVDS